MLDEKTLKVLEFLNEHPDKWFSLEELCENGVPADWETLKWMQEREMVSKQESDDPVGRALGERTYIYRFGAAGRVTLEEHKHSVRTERRANIAIGISLLSLFVSVFTSLRGKTLIATAKPDSANEIKNLSLVRVLISSSFKRIK